MHDTHELSAFAGLAEEYGWYRGDFSSHVYYVYTWDFFMHKNNPIRKELI